MTENKFSIKTCLLATLFSVVVLIVLTLVVAVIAKMTSISENIITVSSYVISSVAGICGGISAGKGTRSKGVLCGAVVGTLFVILIKLIEYITLSSLTLGNGFYLLAGCIIISSVVGGVVGVN